MPTWIVNADVFSDFAETCGTLVVSELKHRLLKGDVRPGDIFLPGQGLTEAETLEIETAARHHGHASAFGLWRDTIGRRRAPRALTHKHRPENSLISIPERIGDGLYAADLMIAAGNEIISDHVTGQHVQGMVLIEACRQMFIAVSELCHMDDGEGRRSYVVFNKMDVGFQAFTFPLPAQIEYREVSAVSPRPDRVAISAELTVVQNGAVTTTITVEYTLFRPEQLRRKEVEKGSAAVVAYALAVAERMETLAAAE
ncbi:MAG: AfsA-related hotdog domain-containing protein [Hyphomicrobiales bacterium]